MLTNQDVDDFVTLVNEVRTRIAGISTADEVIARHSLNAERKYGEEMVREALYAMIRAALSDNLSQAAVRLLDLRNALLRRDLFLGGFESYEEAARWIHFGCANIHNFRPLSERGAWLRALDIALLLRLIPGPAPTRGHDVRDHVVTEAAMRLRERGYRLGFAGLSFALEKGEQDRCCGEIETMVRKAGGASVSEALQQRLLTQGRYCCDRFLLPRSPGLQPSGPQAVPSIPYGYLMSLALRWTHEPAHPESERERIDQLIALATDLVAVLDLEGHSMMDFLNVDRYSLLLHLQQILVGDSALAFRQIIPTHAVEMMSQLFGWIDADIMREKLGWTVADAVRLAHVALAGAIHTYPAINLWFDGDALAENAGLSSKTFAAMRRHFVHDPDEVNVGFSSPSDATKINFDLKPFIDQPNKALLMVAPAFAALAFFEALATAAREAFPEPPDTEPSDPEVPDRETPDSKIGKAIESMLDKAFRARGITPTAVSKRYAVNPQHPKQAPECDIVIECTDAVILFEIKKKTLTRAAMGGDLPAAVIDLAQSMIRAQKQLGRQELELRRKEGYIEFEDGSRLELRGREVNRIALSLLDWGALQYPEVAREIYRILMGATVDITEPYQHAQEQDPEKSKKRISNLKKTNDWLKTLRKQMQKLANAGVDTKRPCLHWLFLGVPQILFLMERSTSNDEFYAQLRMVKLMGTSRLDMYFDLISWDRMGLKPPMPRSQARTQYGNQQAPARPSG